LPPAILYLPNFLPEKATEQKDIVQSFILDMENALQVTSEPVSVVDAWKAAPPPEANGTSLTSYLGPEVRET
jgi:hypothetical protein